MRKILLFLFVNIALFTSAKVYTLYYGPTQNDKYGNYYEVMIHGKVAYMGVHVSIPRYSHSRVEAQLKDPHCWYMEFVNFSEADNTLIFNDTMHKPTRRQCIISNDLSTLEIKYLRPDTTLPSEKLPLVDIHIDPRAGKDDYIGSPKLRVRVLDPKDKSSDDKD